MKERPILFSGPMVRALLDGSKTQTRRVCKPAANLSAVVEVPDPAERGQVYNGSHFGDEDGEVQFACPYGGRGDRLWVRESFSGPHHREHSPPRDWHSMDEIHCWADGNPEAGDWTKPRPGMFMPRWASRITLEVVSVRVERLQAISEADAIAEGIEQRPCAVPNTRLWRNYDPSNGWTPSVAIPQNSYRSLWEVINGADAWAPNPWVWAVEFRRLP